MITDVVPIKKKSKFSIITIMHKFTKHGRFSKKGLVFNITL